MNKKLVNKVITIIIITIAILFMKNAKVEAASSAKITATSNSAEVGEDVKINVTYTAAAWNLTISGSGIKTDSGKQSETYAGNTTDLAETTKTESVSLDTSKTGTYTIKLTGDITDADGNTTDVDTSVTVVVKEKEVVNPEPEPEPDPEPEPEPEPTISSNAYLKELGIKPLEYDFNNFKQKNMNYTATVPYDITSVEAWYRKADNNQTVKITGGNKLEVGENTITVVVTAEDKKTTQTYKIVVTRQEQEPAENKSEEGLKSLTVAGLTLSQEFNPQVYEYSVILTEDIEKLDINTEVTSEDYKVSISGNENLKEGENIVNITVYDQSDTVISIYKLNVSKTITTTSETEENTAEEEQVKNTTEETSNLQIIVIILLFVVIVIAVLIYVIIHIKPEESEEETKNNIAEEYNNFEDEQFKLDTEKIFEEENQDIKAVKKKGKHF